MMIRAIFAALGILVAGVILATVSPKHVSPEVASSALPPPYATPSVYNWPKAIPQPEGAKLKVPPGFVVDSYAERFALPRYMIQGPSGEVLVSDSVPKPGGRVWILRIKADNPAPVERKLLIQGLDLPY